MNFTLIKIGPSDDEEYPECKRLHNPVSNHYVKTDSFTVLPPLSPQIPGPPPTPNPYRILPPIVSRKRPSFVIIQELGSRPQSREPSPSGRVSPFRGCGFRPPSREHSPARDEKEIHQSRSRLPIAKQSSRKVSKSVSPVGTKSSNIPRPLNRRISYSPNRAQEILREIDSRTRKQFKPLKSSENLTNVRNATKKPPLPQKQKAKINPKSPERKPVSPTKMTLRPELKKMSSPAKRPPIKPKPIPKTPEKGKLSSSKSKENLAPSKIPSPARTPVKKLPPKSPNKVIKNEKNISIQSFNEEKPNTVVGKLVEPEEKSNDESKDKATAMKNVKRKAVTSNIIMNARKSKKDIEKKSPVGTPKKDDEKKDLPHTDTSKSLPILVGSSNMTESSATLIRTTTEPALAPVEPDLINEIRSAMNESKREEETCTKENKKDLLTNHIIDSPILQTSTQKESEKTEEAKIIESIIQAEHEIEKIVTKSEIKSPLIDRKEHFQNSPKLMKESMIKNSPQLSHKEATNSPRPIHVVAVTKIEEPKQEITNVGKIKQEPENEVSSVSNSLRSDNRNGMSKSSWLNEKPKPADMKKPSLKKSSKEHPSQENLMERTKSQSKWNKLKPRCPKCLKKSEKTLQISTITKANDIQDLPKKSCFKRYFCCFCYKCKLKNKKMKPAEQPKSNKNCRWRCCSCKDCFKNLFNKISCKKKSKNITIPNTTKSDSGVACVNVPKKRGCCGNCGSRIFKCFSIFCCLNTAFCLKLNTCCKKFCYCKCLCDDGKKKKVTEAERRKSTISAPKKRRWTRVFTDFPKLDTSFVEHGSMMRGAIPVLPVPLAWICLILNVFLPGFGTLSSGIFCLFVGKPRFSVNDSIVSRIGAFLVNLLVAGSQLFTVLFCLVGWGWSIWWGVMMLKMARKNKRITLAEQASNVPHVAPVLDQNHDTERGLANG